MKKHYILLNLLLLILFFVSCSKEKQLEKTLYKKEGNWNVKSADWSQVLQSSTSGQSVITGSSTDAGTFSFDEDGGGSYDFTLGTETYSESFSWSVSEETFSITKISQSIDFFTGDITQIVISFSGTQVNKTTIEMDGSDTRQYTSGDITQSVMAGSFILSK